MTKLEMVKEILKPENKAEEDYAESVARKMRKEDIADHYRAHLRYGEGYTMVRRK